MDWSNFNPIRALFWSAVLNGVAAVPIMAAMMIVASNRTIMGHLHERRPLLIFGWSATAVMALASAAMLVASFGG
jgi:Mn2+/Fe2+ NRAMP family transporter